MKHQDVAVVCRGSMEYMGGLVCCRLYVYLAVSQDHTIKSADDDHKLLDNFLVSTPSSEKFKDQKYEYLDVIKNSPPCPQYGIFDLETNFI